MEPDENWDRIKSLFEKALEHKSTERLAYLKENAPNASVLEEVLRLLAENDEAGSFLSSPAYTRLESPASYSLAPGDVIDDKFKIIRLIAEGGMGEVWLAEQKGPLKREVVVKLVKSAIYNDLLLQRFRAERQSLAIMNHPSIAKVFDAGATQRGQPFLVMEYVPGLPITEFCDQKQLSIEQRLELFILVCDGVQHAHQKAIIHRDLKPANILVVEVDGKPTPRIIDFGIAKANEPMTGESFTQVGAFIGTPGYMSPEQTDPRISDVDTRTDVYSLGVVLYALLAGSPPFETKQWKKCSLEEMLRRLREYDPPRPSTKVSTSRDTNAKTAKARGTDPKRLVGILSGDLDWIVMKAIEKDRNRRYATPSELANDINRHLRNQPVIARPASVAYRSLKYVRRHRVGAIATAGIFVLIVAFMILQAIQLRRTTQERDRANRERDRAGRVTDFMTSMFKVSDPGEARGNSVTAREILDKASKDIRKGLPNDLRLQAQMMNAMGTVYVNLGLYPQAESLFKESTDIRRRILGSEHPDTIAAINALAGVLENEGRYAEAEKLDRQTLEVGRRVLGSENLNTIETMNLLANVMDDEGNFVEAEKLDRETLDLRRRVLGPENPDTISSINNLANVLEDEGHFAEAEQLYRESLDVGRRVQGPDHPSTLGTMNNLGALMKDEGHYADAERLYRESLAIRLRVLGPDHPGTMIAISNLGDVLAKEGDYAEAETLARKSLNTALRVLGPEHPYTAYFRYNLGCLKAMQGRHDQALTLLREAVDHGLPARADLGMEKDPDLKSLFGDPRFEALVVHAKNIALAKGGG
jgi:eukaryotic-like serine/threonine-protein kinase